MSSEAWFRPKRFGFGATPTNWKGWLFIGLMVALLVAMRLILLPGNAVAFGGGVVVWIAIVTAVCAAKSKGQWRWHWGERDLDNDNA